VFVPLAHRAGEPRAAFGEFPYWERITSTILYGNTRIAVKNANPPRPSADCIAQSVAAKFGRPGRGNDKGNLEGVVGYARRNFMVQVPRAVGLP
jgi:transposase